jgi:hypothetical protein
VQCACTYCILHTLHEEEISGFLGAIKISKWRGINWDMLIGMPSANFHGFVMVAPGFSGSIHTVIRSNVKLNSLSLK